MSRAWNRILLSLLCVYTSQVFASNSHKPVSTHEDDLSSKQHFKGEAHDAAYDHDAFLGEDEASAWEKLPVAEVKKRLKALFPKIDVNKDDQLSISEMYDWIEQHMRKHVLAGADMRMKDMDKNKDGKVSWDEYIAVEYDPSTEEGLAKETIEELKEVKRRDKNRFEFADADNDQLLSRDELTLFLHPEESKRMTSYLVQENIEVFDKNKDGKVSLQEYLGGEGIKLDAATIDSLSNSFRNELDINRDGFLDREEIRKWILPGFDDDPIKSEANHLMKQGDDNSDNFLSVDEIVAHHDVFAGSRVTRYGDLLKDEF